MFLIHNSEYFPFTNAHTHTYEHSDISHMLCDVSRLTQFTSLHKSDTEQSTDSSNDEFTVAHVGIPQIDMEHSSDSDSLFKLLLLQYHIQGETVFTGKNQTECLKQIPDKTKLKQRSTPDFPARPGSENSCKRLQYKL